MGPALSPHSATPADAPSGPGPETLQFGRPLDPRTGAPIADIILPGAAERASGLFADLTEQRWDQVVAGFNQQMSERLDASALAAVWAQVSYSRIGQVGGTFVQQNL